MMSRMWKIKKVAKTLERALLGGSIMLALAFGAKPAAAGDYSHEYIESTRSGIITHYYIASSVENEVAQVLVIKDGKEASENWRGYGLGSELGMELLKFMKVSINHSFLTSKSNSRRGTDTTGSRLGVSNYFVFSSPIGNLELGGGVNASRYDYQEGYDRATIYGQSTYFGGGVNYYLSFRSSVYVHIRSGTEDCHYGSGDHAVDELKSQFQGISVGMSLWQ